MNQVKKVFGIDLGTTYSCVAFVDEYGKALVLNNIDNQPTTPSVVYFNEKSNKVEVGKIAKEASKINPDFTVSFIKRQMSNNDAFNKPTDFPTKKPAKYTEGCTPTEISAFILKKIVKDANDAWKEIYPDDAKLIEKNPIKQVVITCPAYFNTAERERVKEAGKLAGLKVLSIIEEPVAAAVSYGIKIKSNQTVLVYDLGGGTFDVTLIKISEDKMEVIDKRGNSRLGGYDWDKKLAEYLLSEYNRKKHTKYELQEGTALFNEIMLTAEDVKQTLTKRDSTEARVTVNNETEEIPVTRATFEEKTKIFLDETIKLTHKAVEFGEENGVENIDEILLVGGSSYMPQVRDRLKSEFNKEPKLADPHQSVAKGAAVYAQDLAREDDDGEKTLGISERFINVTSKNYGTDFTYKGETKTWVQNIIFASTPIENGLCQREFSGFSVSEGAAESHRLRFVIYESDIRDDVYDPSRGEKIMEQTIPLASYVQAGDKMKVVFKIDAENILHVHSEIEGMQEKFEFDVPLKGTMSQKELEHGTAVIASIKTE